LPHSPVSSAPNALGFSCGLAELREDQVPEGASPMRERRAARSCKRSLAGHLAMKRLMGSFLFAKPSFVLVTETPEDFLNGRPTVRTAEMHVEYKLADSLVTV